LSSNKLLTKQLNIMSELRMSNFKDNESKRMTVLMPIGLLEFCDRYKAAYDRVSDGLIHKNQVYLLMIDLGVASFCDKVIELEGVVKANSELLKNAK